jgi:transposase
MVSAEIEAKILRLYHAEKWRIETIARELGTHHSVVRRVLAKGGVADGLLYFVRPSMADPFIPLIVETLERHPRLSGSRLYEMVRERGYPGGPDHFRHIVARHRPQPKAEAYLRLQTIPGEQAQVDWAHFATVLIGRAVRRLSAFVMTLSWSRKLFARFYLDQKLENLLRGHEAAFQFFGGVSRVCLYDNPRTIVLEREGDAIRFHPTLLRFAGHYRYEPRPVAVARGNEKGRVERAIRYLRQSFFAAREWTDIDDLNAQALVWCEGIASERRCPVDKSLTVREAHELEKSKLLPLPDNPFPTDERVEIHTTKQPYIRFDLNDYSVPHDRLRPTLTVVADLKTVRILDGTEVIATHERSFDRNQTIEEPSHVANLVAWKRQARKHRAMDCLQRAAPTSRELLIHLAEQGQNLGSATAALMRLLDLYGAESLEAAIVEAIEKGSPHPHSVRHVLERRRREQGKPPALPVRLPASAKVRDVSVRPHSLKTYESLNKEKGDEEEKSE